jgi:hypothetical protein
MSVHDRAVEYRRRLVAVIEASPNRRAACREAGIHHSTFYRWRAEATRDTPHKRVGWSEVLLGRRIVGAALADPAAGPRRIADGLRDAGVVVSASKVWRVLVKHRLNTRQLRYQLLEQHAGGPVPSIVVASTPSRRVGRLDAEVPGDLVQMDCLHIGSFKETKLGRGKHSKGQIWQYTAIDVASSYTWAELHATPHNPDPAITSALAHQVAADLTAWGWTWKAVPFKGDGRGAKRRCRGIPGRRRDPVRFPLAVLAGSQAPLAHFVRPSPLKGGRSGGWWLREGPPLLKGDGRGAKRCRGMPGRLTVRSGSGKVVDNPAMVALSETKGRNGDGPRVDAITAGS